MTKKKKIGLIVGTVILFFLSAVSILIIILSSVIPTSFDEDNTVEHQASVIEVIDKEKVYEVKVEEYRAALVFSKDIYSDEISLLALGQGDQISFRIPDFVDDSLNDSDSGVLIVSLYAGDTPIFTLKDYDNADKESLKKIHITAGVFSGLFFCGAIVCLVFLIKSKNQIKI